MYRASMRTTVEIDDDLLAVMLWVWSPGPSVTLLLAGFVPWLRSVRSGLGDHVHSPIESNVT